MPILSRYIFAIVCPTGWEQSWGYALFGFVPFVSPPMTVFVTIDFACSSGCCGRIELVKDDVSNEAIECLGTGISFQYGGVSHVPGSKVERREYLRHYYRSARLEDSEWNQSKYVY